MQISSFSDYALRTLVFLAVSGDEPVPVRVIAARHGISFDHLAKVAQFLVREGFATASRGRGGGLRLVRPAAEISVGTVLRLSEGDAGPVECLRGETPIACVLAPVCGLTPILRQAREAFFASLDGHTLAEALPRHAPVRRVLGMT